MASSSSVMAKKISPDTVSDLVQLAKIEYRNKMEKITSTRKFVEESVFQEAHEAAFNFSMEMISKRRTLTDEHKKKLVKGLNETMKLLKKINLKKKDSNAPAIGIDLGTTFCCMAVYWSMGKKYIIPSELGENKTPSYIAFPNRYYSDDEDEDDEELDNEPIFGETAKMMAHDNPLFTIYDVKRTLGRKFNDPQIQKDIQSWSFQVVNDREEIKVKTGPDTIHTPLELTTLLVKHLKVCAEKCVNEEVVNAVVTVPAHFNAKQRDLTKEACNLAGLNVLQLITEPTAAAVAYKIHRKPIEKRLDYKCLIFDFGGGTLDLALLTMQKDKMFILGIGGDPHLGGEDVDTNMVEYCIGKFKEQHGVDLNSQKQSANDEVVFKTAKRLRRLKLQCEEQKRFLSETETVVISLDAIHGSIPLVVPMTRNIFNEINKRLFETCLEKVDKVLKDANLEPNSVDEVVLVGGSSRIPKVQEMLSGYFPGKQLLRSVDLDEAVAVGAAMLAFQTENVEIPNVRVQELQCNHTELSFLRNQISLQTFQTNEAAKIKKLQNPSISCKLLSCAGIKRAEHAAVAVNGTIFSFGGMDSPKGPINIHILKTLDSPLLWKLIPVKTNNAFTPSQRKNHTVVASGHLIYLWGGSFCNNKIHVLNTKTLEWEKCEVKGVVPANRHYHTATVVRNKMYVFGGYEYGKGNSNSIKCLDLSTFSWSSISPKNDPPTPRWCHSATVHGDRFILIFGGWEEGRGRCNSLVCFDVERNEWTFPEVTGTIPEPRSNHCAFSHNGFMYIFGGRGSSRRLNDLFCFDFENSEWLKETMNGHRPDPRFSSQSVVIKDQVFIFGGLDTNLKICMDDFVLAIE